MAASTKYSDVNPAQRHPHRTSANLAPPHRDTAPTLQVVDYSEEEPIYFGGIVDGDVPTDMPIEVPKVCHYSD